VVAVARKLAMIMHAVWREGAVYADRPHAGGAPTAKERKPFSVGA
jgi:transposase